MSSGVVALGRSFFTSISLVSIVEPLSGGWTLFYDQDIVRSPHLDLLHLPGFIIIRVIISMFLCIDVSIVFRRRYFLVPAPMLFIKLILVILVVVLSYTE